jgi:tRNA-(ms[2]io[6]A)-hydroxylase
MIRLREPTPSTWLETALAHFDSFLLDHASCERKASATGMLFVVRYPDRTALIEPMIEFAREELEHFHKVYRIIERRGLRLLPDAPDPYARRLFEVIRHGRNERLLDRLLVAAVLEARGCERFGVLAGALTGELRELYRELTRADARHQRLFVDLAHEYFDGRAVEERAGELLEIEGQIVRNLPVRAALY